MKIYKTLFSLLLVFSVAACGQKANHTHPNTTAMIYDVITNPVFNL
jgi:hypothetical protein